MTNSTSKAPAVSARVTRSQARSQPDVAPVEPPQQLTESERTLLRLHDAGLDVRQITQRYNSDMNTSLTQRRMKSILNKAQKKAQQLAPRNSPPPEAAQSPNNETDNPSSSPGNSKKRKHENTDTEPAGPDEKKVKSDDGRSQKSDDAAPRKPASPPAAVFDELASAQTVQHEQTQVEPESAVAPPSSEQVNPQAAAPKDDATTSATQTHHLPPAAVSGELASAHTVQHEQTHLEAESTIAPGSPQQDHPQTLASNEGATPAISKAGIESTGTTEEHNLLNVPNDIPAPGSLHNTYEAPEHNAAITAAPKPVLGSKRKVTEVNHEGPSGENDENNSKRAKLGDYDGVLTAPEPPSDQTAVAEPPKHVAGSKRKASHMTPSGETDDNKTSKRSKLSGAGEKEATGTHPKNGSVSTAKTIPRPRSTLFPPVNKENFIRVSVSDAGVRQVDYLGRPLFANADEHRRGYLAWSGDIKDTSGLPERSHSMTRMYHLTTIEHKLDRMESEFNISTINLIEEYEEVMGSVQAATNAFFMRWYDGDIEKHRGTMAYDMNRDLPELLEAWTGHSGQAGIDILISSLNSANRLPDAEEAQPVDGVDFGYALCSALLFQMVWSKSDISVSMGVPCLRADDNMLLAFDAIAEHTEHEAALLHWIWREARKKHLEKPEFKNKVAELSKEVFDKFEKVMLLLTRRDGPTLKPAYQRDNLVKAFGEAIMFKCKLELTASQYEFRWQAQIGQQFNRSQMQAEAEEILAGPMNDERIPDRLHRVRLPLGPALYERRYAGFNPLGMDAHERANLVKRLRAQGLKDEEIGDRGFLPEKCLFKAKVTLRDGFKWQNSSS